MQMNPHEQLCPKCQASGKDGWITIHSQKEKRYRCKGCGATFSERQGTAYVGIKKDVALFTIVVTLLAYGCPPQAIVEAYGLDRRTVRRWYHRAGEHSRAVHARTVWQRQWDLIHVQADEIKVRVQGGVMWITLAIMVSTRLWLGGAVDTTRSKAMIVECLCQVARCALCRPLLLAVDGLNMYQNAIKQAFRSRHPLGKGGRMKYIEWGNVRLTQVVKARGNQRGQIEHVVTIGTEAETTALRQRSRGGFIINTAFIERFNATVRQRLACLTRRGRAAVKQQCGLESGIFLMGCVYNFCTDHRSLAEALYFTPRRRHWIRRTPAMAAGLTDHRWTVEELLQFRILGDAA
jgi:transposase-like protein